MAAYVIMNLFSSRPFKLVKNLSNFSGSLAKPQPIVIEIAPPPKLIQSKLDDLSSYFPFQEYSDSVNTVRYRSKPDMLVQMREHSCVKEFDDHPL